MGIFDFLRKRKKNDAAVQDDSEQKLPKQEVRDFNSYDTVRAVVEHEEMNDPKTHTNYTSTVYSDGSFNATFEPDEFENIFSSLSEKIEREKDLAKKAALCEKCYEFLPEFCKFYIDLDGELPPFIVCRDAGPWAYEKLGEYDKAEEAVKKCIKAQAYYPDDGSEALEMIRLDRRIAEQIISFLKENAGFKQRNIYKQFEFTPEEKESAQRFLKYSELIRKVKSGSTNELYLK